MGLTSEGPCKSRFRSDSVKPLKSSSLNGKKATDMDQVYLGDQVMTKGSSGAMELIEPLMSLVRWPGRASQRRGHLNWVLIDD